MTTKHFPRSKRFTVEIFATEEREYASQPGPIVGWSAELKLTNQIVQGTGQTIPAALHDLETALTNMASEHITHVLELASKKETNHVES